jgi:hypothetical protein
VIVSKQASPSDGIRSALNKGRMMIMIAIYGALVLPTNKRNELDNMNSRELFFVRMLKLLTFCLTSNYISVAYISQYNRSK